MAQIIELVIRLFSGLHIDSPKEKKSVVDLLNILGAFFQEAIRSKIPLIPITLKESVWTLIPLGAK